MTIWRSASLRKGKVATTRSRTSSALVVAITPLLVCAAVTSLVLFDWRFLRRRKSPVTDRTGVDIIKVHTNGGGLERDWWRIDCARCSFSELVNSENAARKGKVEHIFAKCIATSDISPEPLS